MKGSSWLHGAVATRTGQGALVNYKGVPAFASSPQESWRCWGIQLAD
jgi:hypothetical protein